MSDLEARALRKRITLPSQFTYPVLVEQVNLFGTTALVRVGKPLRAEPTPGAQKDERADEQKAIDTFLASFQDITRSVSAGPLFEQASRKRPGA
jgi:hypothetical protein